MTPSPRPSLLVPCLAGAAQGLVFINHAPLVPLIMRDLGISPAEAGLLSTAVFGVGGILAIPLGALTDRLGPKRTMTLCLALFTVTAVGLGLAPGYPSMLGVRLVAGAGLTGTFIAGGAYVARLWAGRDLYLAQGLFGGSMQLGIGLAIFLLPWAAEGVGWRLALALCALPVALAGLVWHRAAVDLAPAAHGIGRVGRVFRDPAVWRLGMVNGASFGLSIVLGTWITVYFVHEFGLPLTVAGSAGSLSVLLGVVARPIGGLLVARGRPTARRMILGTLAGSTATLVLLAWPGRPVAAAIAAVVGLGIASSLGYAALITLVGRAQPAATGAALGTIAVFSTAVVVVGAPVTGALLSLGGDFTLPFLVLALLPAAALAWCTTLPEG